MECQKYLFWKDSTERTREKDELDRQHSGNWLQKPELLLPRLWTLLISLLEIPKMPRVGLRGWPWPRQLGSMRCVVCRSRCELWCFSASEWQIYLLCPGNSLLLNPSMQPDLTVSRTYSGPICLQDPLDKELMTESSLFNPLSDIKVKVQSSFMVSLGVSERAEYHGKNHSGTFPHGNNRSFTTVHARNKTPYIQNLSSLPTRTELRTTGVFGHLGGRLVMPNTGGW